MKNRPKSLTILLTAVIIYQLASLCYGLWVKYEIITPAINLMMQPNHTINFYFLVVNYLPYLMNIIILISAVGLLFAKQWARSLLTVCTTFLIIINSFTLFSFSPNKGTIIITIISLFFNILIFYLANRQSTRAFCQNAASCYLSTKKQYLLLLSTATFIWLGYVLIAFIYPNYPALHSGLIPGAAMYGFMLGELLGALLLTSIIFGLVYIIKPKKIINKRVIGLHRISFLWASIIIFGVVLFSKIITQINFIHHNLIPLTH